MRVCTLHASGGQDAFASTSGMSLAVVAFFEWFEGLSKIALEPLPMLFSEGNVESRLAPPVWRALLDAARLPDLVNSRVTRYGQTGARRPPRLLVRSLAVILPTV